MRDLAPHITRQRLLIEGFYSIEIDRSTVDRYLHGVAEHLGLRAYGEATIFSPGGEGKAENQGFDAFLPLIDSGLSLYVWSSSRFFSVVLFTCRRFDEEAAVAYTRTFFGATGEVAYEAF